MFRLNVLGIVGLAVACNAAANDIELSISNDLIDARFKAEYEQDFSGKLAYMHADQDGIDTDQLSYTFATQGRRDRFDISLGARLFIMDAESEDGYGAALGIGAETELADKVSVSAEIYYSPDILTGGDIDNTQDAEIRVGYQLIENGMLYVGHRWFEVDVDGGGDVDIYEDPYLGIRFTF